MADAPAMGADSGWADALSAGLRRSLTLEWSGSPPHLWKLGRVHADGLSSAPPREARRADRRRGIEILDGVWRFDGVEMALRPKQDPFDRPSPERSFAVTLHQFGWLRDLLATGAAGRQEAVRLLLAWREVFGRWNDFAWSDEVLERRVLHWACGLNALVRTASEDELAALADELARQATQLLSSRAGPVRAAERAAAAAAAGCALAGVTGRDLLERALPLLDRALAQTVTADGGHAGRNPEAALELLLDLMTLCDGLARRDRTPSAEVERAMTALAAELCVLRLGDRGPLAAFHGGRAASAPRVGQALDRLGFEGPGPGRAGGFHRLTGGRLTVVVDGAGPPVGAWSLDACAQPLALEVAVDSAPLIVNVGAGPQSAPVLRGAGAGSTVQLLTPDGRDVGGGALIGFRARMLGQRLQDAGAVTATRHQTEAGAWLDLAHASPAGVTHERRLYLDVEADELRGDDKVLWSRTDGEGAPELTATLRFHLHPDVGFEVLPDRRGVTLTVGGEAWRLRTDSRKLVLEPSLRFEDGQARRTTQVTLHAPLADGEARFRWKLARA